MQKKIIALAVAGLSTAAFAQTNVTIYGVADVSAQGYNMSSGRALAGNGSNTDGTSIGRAAAGGAFGMTNNSSLIGFKGTEDLGNGLKALFQIETNVAITGNNGVGGNTAGTSNSSFGSARDSYVGLNSKYGTVLGGYLSTPYRAVVTGFDVMPGATGVGRSENIIGTTRLNTTNLGGTVNTGGYVIGQSVRSTALAYAMPTLYGFNGSIAYTGSNRNAWGNEGQLTAAVSTTGVGSSTLTTVAPQSAISLNLGWEGYGIGIKGAYQQAKVNFNQQTEQNFQGVTSYVVGAQYTGIQGLKAAVMYNRNSIGMNGTATDGAQKGSNNQVWAGVSYRFGNNEPRLSYATTSNTNGLNGMGQDGAKQWTANWGYYLSKRTQVYGLVSGLSNNANGIYNMAGNGTNLAPTGGQGIVTYGAGLRTNF